METFTLDPHSWRIARVFGRNPLLRRTDRIEAVVMLAALVASLLAIPVVGVAGTVVYGARDHLYVQEAQARHAVMATVAGASGPLDQDSRAVVVQARWPGPAGERTGSFQYRVPVKAGERIEIWVDDDGNLVGPPTPTWHAAIDAVGTAIVALLLVGAAMTSLVAAVRSRLDRARDAEWEHEIRCFQEDGGRTNRH